jgi:HK97 gp10 family phage protein
MGFTLNRELAMSIAYRHVDQGVREVAALIEGEAKRRAPVRKTRRYDRKSNRMVGGYGRGKPLRVGYFAQGADRPLRDDAFLALVQKGRADREAAVARARLFKLPLKTQTPMSVHEEFMATLKANKLELRPFSDDGSITSAAKKDIARGHGVNFNTKTGRAVLGGTLRKSIRIVPAGKSARVIRRTVRAHAPYAKFVEFPTARTSAQPFMRPALKMHGTVQKLKQASKW